MDLTRTQLFLDDALIESAYRLQRRVHPPRMLPEPVLRPERPWEYRAVILFGTVLRQPDTGELHMYYQTFGKEGRTTVGTYVCLATSTDGLDWRRPSLGCVPFEGSTDNNIILAPPASDGHIDSPSVVYDPDDPDPQRRYKLACFATSPKQPGMYVAFSADGLKWRWHDQPVNRAGDRSNLMPARLNGKFVQFNRHAAMMEYDHRYGTGGRSCSISTSDDFLNWTEPKLVLAPDLGDPAELQFYVMAGFPYHDQYIGWVQRLWGGTDTLDLELLSSRDGLTWQRLSGRQAFIPLGAKGLWYDTWVDLPSSPPLDVNGELYWYVSGRAQGHGYGEPLPYGAIGVASQRAHTMVSLSAGLWPAQLTTKPIRWPGGDLWLQYSGPADSYHLPVGDMSVRVLDADGTAIAGYDDNPSMHTPGRNDYLWHRVRWQNDQRSLDALAGQTIKLQIRYTEAALYALKAGPEARPE